ncbi:hypothetical protein J2S51_006598 [Streptomyces sp. DSM 41269]|nr:hypothetical protein [Streptomyces sp. DSM 41269]
MIASAGLPVPPNRRRETKIHSFGWEARPRLENGAPVSAPQFDGRSARPDAV